MRSSVATVFLAIALILVFVAPASADGITILNPSFETPFSTGITSPVSWTAIGSGGLVDSYNPYTFGNPNGYYLGANPTTDPDAGGAGYPGIVGEMYAFAFLTNPGSGFEQTLTATLQADTVYTLSIDVGQRNGSSYAAPWLGSGLELLAGDTVIASSILDTFAEAPTDGFMLQTATVDSSTLDQSLLGEQLTVEFFTTMPVTVSEQATDWDCINLNGSGCITNLPSSNDSASVPEPATLFLIGTGLLGIPRRFRFR
jgi:hypothetical protein